MKKYLLLFLFSQIFYAQENALVKQNDKFGYINKTGNFSIEPQYKVACTGACLHHRRRQGICAARDGFGLGYRCVRWAAVLLLWHWHELLHGSVETARRADFVAPRDGRPRREGRTLQDAPHALPDLGCVTARARPL